MRARRDHHQLDAIGSVIGKPVWVLRQKGVVFREKILRHSLGPLRIGRRRRREVVASLDPGADDYDRSFALLELFGQLDALDLLDRFQLFDGLDRLHLLDRRHDNCQQRPLLERFKPERRSTRADGHRSISEAAERSGDWVEGRQKHRQSLPCLSTRTKAFLMEAAIWQAGPDARERQTPRTPRKSP